MLSLVEIGPVVLAKIFEFRQCIFTISKLSPLWKEGGPSFDLTLVPFTQRCFVPSLVEFSPLILEKKIFFISSMYFRYFVHISPFPRAGPFIWTNLNPLYPRMLCAKFGWNWPSGSGEEDEYVKSLRQWQQRRRWKTKYFDQKSSLEPKLRLRLAKKPSFFLCLINNVCHPYRYYS